MINHEFIGKTLAGFEGEGICKGYVPMDKQGKVLGVSGVTIAKGLDLGQQTRSSLEAMKLPPALVNRFSPYLGAKKEEAVYLLAKSPLQITPEECAEVERCVDAFYIKNTAARFDKKVAAAEGN